MMLKSKEPSDLNDGSAAAEIQKSGSPLSTPLLDPGSPGIPSLTIASSSNPISPLSPVISPFQERSQPTGKKEEKKRENRDRNLSIQSPMSPPAGESEGRKFAKYMSEITRQSPNSSRLGEIRKADFKLTRTTTRVTNILGFALELCLKDLSNYRDLYSLMKRYTSEAMRKDFDYQACIYQDEKNSKYYINIVPIALLLAHLDEPSNAPSKKNPYLVKCSSFLGKYTPPFLLRCFVRITKWPREILSHYHHYSEQKAVLSEAETHFKTYLKTQGKPNDNCTNVLWSPELRTLISDIKDTKNSMLAQKVNIDIPTFLSTKYKNVDEWNKKLNDQYRSNIHLKLYNLGKTAIHMALAPLYYTLPITILGGFLIANARYNFTGNIDMIRQQRLANLNMTGITS